MLELYDADGSEFYYCDRVGFRQIEFAPPQEMDMGLRNEHLTGCFFHINIRKGGIPMPKAQTKATAPTPAPDTPLPVEYAVRIYPVKDSKYTLANANVDINGVFAIRGVTVSRGEKGPFVAMPQYKDSHGDYHDICFPCTKEARQQPNDAVLNAYEQSLRQAQQPDNAPAAEQVM